MANWVKCKSSATGGIPVWVNLDLAQTLIRDSSDRHTVIRFGGGEDDAIDVVEQPEDLLKLAKK
jgi:hypothetical protein